MNTYTVPKHSYEPTAEGARQHRQEVNEYVANLNTENELLVAARELLSEYYNGGGDAQLASGIMNKIEKVLIENGTIPGQKK
jgi:hypothetical protein